MPEVCRACLQIIESTSDTYCLDAEEADFELLTLGQKLAACIPELVLDVTHKPVLCWSCTTTVRYAYGFRQQCLESEEKIKAYMQKTGSSSIHNLRQVLESRVEISGNTQMPMLNGNNNISAHQVTDKQAEPVVVVELVDEAIVSPVAVQPVPSVSCKKAPASTFRQPLTIIHRCKKCDFCTSMASTYYRHMKGHENDKLALDDPNITSGNLLRQLLVEKLYRCEKCSYETSKISRFKVHQRLHGSQKQYVCELCEFNSDKYAELVLHRKQHTAGETSIQSANSVQKQSDVLQFL